jgi:hypothetical protein
VPAREIPEEGARGVPGPAHLGDNLGGILIGLLDATESGGILKIRETAMGVATFLHWIANFVVSQTFPSLLAALGPDIPFLGLRRNRRPGLHLRQRVRDGDQGT